MTGLSVFFNESTSFLVANSANNLLAVSIDTTYRSVYHLCGIAFVIHSATIEQSMRWLPINLHANLFALAFQLLRTCYMCIALCLYWYPIAL